MTPYLEFLRSKMKVAPATGFDVDDADINPDLAPHCRAIVKWALQGGRAQRADLLRPARITIH